MPEDPAPSAPASPPPGRVYEVLTPGERIGEYAVEACISYDILGSLYRVSAFNGDQKTLFVLPKLLSDDESFMRRFKDLREKLQQIACPAILSLGESITIDGRICFTAESFSGKSIPDYLGAAGIYPTYQNPQGVIRAQPSEEAKDFTADRIRKVATTMLESLICAHAKGALHLNLTPSNVLQSETGDIKVVGFGLYSIIGQASIEALVSAGIPAVSLGPRNVRLNTADIISPEVHLKQDPDARADIYALGMSVYWMLTGLKPTANYRPPSGIVPGLDPGWDIFLARCLAREKNKRYANATAALRDLEKLDKLTTSGYADAASRTGTEKSVKKRRKLIAISLVTIAALAVAGVTATLLTPEEKDADDIIPEASPYTRATDTPVAYIFKVNHAGARVTVAKPMVTFGVKNGEVRISAPTGKTKFTVAAPGMTPRTMEINYDGKTTRTVVVQLAKNAGTLEVTSAPGAEVFLSGEGPRISLGLTDQQGKLVADGIASGVYTLEIEKEKCKPASIPGLEIKTREKTQKSVTIEGAPSTLLIESTPAGAQIMINGVEQGSSPLKLDKLKAGSELTIVFSKENYRPVTRTLVIDAGETITLKSGPMQPAKGRVSYAVKMSGKPLTPEAYNRLTVKRSDDQLKARDWTAALALPKEVAVGHYVLKVEHPDCEPYQTAFAIADDKTTTVDINLRTLPSPVEFTLTPENLRYTLRVNNREYVDEFPASLPSDVPLHIELESRDYEVWKYDLVARPRQTTSLEVVLKKLAGPTRNQRYTLPYLGIQLAWIPSGEIRLGSPSGEVGRTDAEGPFTWAAFTTGYWMGVTEVTQGEFERVLGYNPAAIKRAGLPVTAISSLDALRFCKAINERELKVGRLPFGYEYRLPNELEWEYACRAGSTAAFSFGETAGPAQGNFHGTYPATPGDTLHPEGGAARPVASYPANNFGLHDMHGNVREWILGPYKSHLPGGRRENFNIRVTDLASQEATTRGGSYRKNATECRSAARPRSPIRPDVNEEDLGFRIVLAPSPLP